MPVTFSGAAAADRRPGSVHRPPSRRLWQVWPRDTFTRSHACAPAPSPTINNANQTFANVQPGPSVCARELALPIGSTDNGRGRERHLPSALIAA
jgi:hypothetical protein